MSSDYDDDDRTRDDPWGHDPESLTPPSMPMSVKAAGVIWILFGVAGIILQILNFAVVAAENAQNQPQPPGASTGSCCGIFFAIAFFIVGYQTLRGTAKDTLGNAIGSLIFAVLYLGGAVLVIAAGAMIAGGNIPNNGQPLPAGAADQDELMFMMVFASIMLGSLGSMLLLAGVLALVGRSGYLAWRRATKPTNLPSRRQYAEDREEDDDRGEDDYDDRRRDRY